MNPLSAVLSEFGWPKDARLTPIDHGLINTTFRVDGSDGSQAILQKVNPIFSPNVHADIEAVTTHLSAKGVPTPRLLPTQKGALFFEHAGVWRMLTFIPGETRTVLKDADQAREAGRLLAHFHQALSDLTHTFQNRRLGVHDTAKHLAHLTAALENHRGQHPRYHLVAPLGWTILDLTKQLPVLPSAPDQVVHGDPKLSNLLFDAASGQGLALVDLDTLSRGPRLIELGDAFRSWCNPSGEDARQAQFSLPLFAGAITGYAEGLNSALAESEWTGIVPATQTIILELAARFAADALEESYFGWDSHRFASRGEHNELRARGQLALFHSLVEQREAAERLVKEAFARVIFLH